MGEGINKDEMEAIKTRFFPYKEHEVDIGLKYLGFILKLVSYTKNDWNWLISKCENRIANWSFRWLSKAGRLVLEKYVLEATPIFWSSLSWIPKGVLVFIRRLIFRFFWMRNLDLKNMA